MSLYHRVPPVNVRTTARDDDAVSDVWAIILTILIVVAGAG
jgi:FlaG/FlaF family flagellin (archaellin)